jgi:hypothetical protein
MSNPDFVDPTKPTRNLSMKNVLGELEKIKLYLTKGDLAEL